MKLYDTKMAPSPRRLRIFLAEKGITVPTAQIDITTGETQGDAFKTINPLGELPVLEFDDGRRFTESLAIARYFEATHPEPNLLGRSPEEALEIDMWCLQILLRLYGPISHVFQHTHKARAGRGPQVQEYGELARTQALAEMSRIDGHLADREFLSAGRFTMADIMAFTSIDFGKPTNTRIDPATQPHLKRWYDAIAARPSTKA
jgi:glutathione S-transferase